MPHLATCIFLFFYNEPELGVGINPGMALTPLPSCIGRGLNPRPSDREPSALPLDHGFCLTTDLYLLLSLAWHPLSKCILVMRSLSNQERWFYNR